VIFAVVLWLALGFSLGWYYTVTYYGRSGWPMPVLEGLGGLILYYFSVQNVPTPLQAVHWMIVFPLAGVVWTTLIHLTAPYFHRPRVDYPRALAYFAMATIPLSLPGPFLAVLAGKVDGGWSAWHMIDVALRRAGVGEPTWLSPVVFALGVATLIAHLAVYTRLFETTLRESWMHYLLTVVLFVLVIAGIGAIAAVPLAIATTGDMPIPPGI
jgi:hypothetical protein